MHRINASPGHDIEVCPVCDLPLSASNSVEHLKACLDGEGAVVPACPVCEQVFSDSLGREARESHIAACCEGGGKNEVEGHAGKFRSLFVYWKKGELAADKFRHSITVFVCDATTIPKDESGTIKEVRSHFILSFSDCLMLISPRPRMQCSVCLEDYEIKAKLARLSCMCVFHEKCIKEWWDMEKGFCPQHVKRKEGERP